MAAIARTFDQLKVALRIGASIPSCPDEISPFILQNHQLYTAKYVHEITNEPINSLMLWHGLGSGKTISSIATAFEMPANTEIIVASQASLMDNYQSELMGDYARKVKDYLDMPHIGLAIDIANKFIAACKLVRLTDGWVKPFIERLIDYVGMTGNIANLQDVDLTRIATRGVAADAAAALTGGRTRRYKRNNRKTKRQRGGYIKEIKVRTNSFRFVSTNGNLSKGWFRDGSVRGDLTNVSLIIIDESQLLISQLKLDYAFTDLFRAARGQIRAGPYRGRDPNLFITMDDFLGRVGGGGGGYQNERAHRLFGELMHRPHTTQVLLLSATPIVKNPFEIAIAVNILARHMLLPINESVFEHNYGSVTPLPPYNYTMTNVARELNIAINIVTRIKNEDYFKQLCSGSISYFGNIRTMMPTLTLLPGHKYIYNNDGIPFISIIECALTVAECIWMKYLQFVCDTAHGGAGHPQFATLKLAFVDCAFRLNFPRQNMARAATRHLAADAFLTSTGRHPQVANITTRFTHSFQSFLDESLEANVIAGILIPVVKPSPHASASASASAPPAPPALPAPPASASAPPAPPASASAPPAPPAPPASASASASAPAPLSALELAVPAVELGELLLNSKIARLIVEIRSNMTQRHVIYINSRYVSVIIGRVLNMLGFMEINDINRSSFSDELKAHEGIKKLFASNQTPYFAFLRGESEDDIDPVTMFKYTQDEGNAKNKAEMIKLFKDPTHDNRFKILIINNCVAEGITLPRVDKIHIFSLPYDLAKLQQIVARVHRNCVHPPGGRVTPLLYLSVGGERTVVNKDWYTNFYPDYPEWQAYARSVPLESDVEITKLVDNINTNDKLLQYYRVLKECSIERMPVPAGPPPAAPPAAAGLPAVPPVPPPVPPPVAPPAVPPVPPPVAPPAVPPVPPPVAPPAAAAPLAPPAAAAAAAVGPRRSKRKFTQKPPSP
jgi:hypothetical protein